MKNLLFIPLLIYITSCSDPDQQYINSIEQVVYDNALSVNMNYRSQEFKWIDTLYVTDMQLQAKMDYNKLLDEIVSFEYFVSDNMLKGNILSLSYITKDRLSDLREWERLIGHSSHSGDYYEFAFAHRNSSNFLSELTSNLELTESLLAVYDQIREGNTDLLRNVTWYYSRIDKYENNQPAPIWDKVYKSIGALDATKYRLDSLMALEGTDIIHYKAYNRYLIDNLVLNNATVEVKKYFMFDSKLSIIDFEDI